MRMRLGLGRGRQISGVQSLEDRPVVTHRSAQSMNGTLALARQRRHLPEGGVTVPEDRAANRASVRASQKSQ